MTHQLKVAALAFLAIAALSVSVSAQTLTVTNDLRIWLDAGAGITLNDTGAVTNWVDQSTNGNIFTQGFYTPPTWVAGAINGKPVVRFTGTQRLTTSNDPPSLAITGDMAFFAVIRFDATASRRGIWLNGAGQDLSLEGSNKPRFRRPDVKDLQVVFRDNQYLVIGVQQAGSAVSCFRSDQVVFTQVNEASVTAGPQFQVGQGAAAMKGDIAEFLMYGAALSDADRLSVVSYLEEKYGIVNLPPTVSLAGDPVDGSTVGAPAQVTLTATASDPDGTIDAVRFYANGQFLGKATNSPYQLKAAVLTPGNASFTAVASDNRDKTTDSAPLSLTVTGAVPAMTATSGLQLWLDAGVGVSTNASGAVTNWADQSGHANDAVQTNDPQAPLFLASAVNGLPAVRFDGAALSTETDFLSVAHNPDILGNNNNVATFFVIKFDDFGPAGGGVRLVWAKDVVGGLARPMQYYITAFGSGIFRASRNAPSASDTVTSALLPVPRHKYMIAGFTMDTNSLVGQSGANILTHYWNGLANSSKGTFHPLVAGDEVTPLRIGANASLSGKMRGEIAELLIYNPGLSQADAFSLQRYLAAKYNIPFIVPVPSVALSQTGTNVVVSWPGVNIPLGLALQSATNLGAPTWTADPNKLTAVAALYELNTTGGRYQVTNSANLDQQYYRLQAP